MNADLLLALEQLKQAVGRAGSSEARDEFDFSTAFGAGRNFRGANFKAGQSMSKQNPEKSPLKITIALIHCIGEDILRTKDEQLKICFAPLPSLTQGCLDGTTTTVNERYEVQLRSFSSNPELLYQDNPIVAVM